MDYYSGRFGFINQNICDKKQNWTLRYHLGVCSKHLVLAIEGDTR